VDAGWLALMLIMTIAGRETTHELNVFQIMEVRSILSLFILFPADPRQRRLAADEASRPLQHPWRNLIHYAAQLCWFFASTLDRSPRLVSTSSPCRSGPRFLRQFLGERITVWKITRSCSVWSAPRDVGRRPAKSIPAVDRAWRSRRFRHFHRHDEVPDPHREYAGHYFLDAGAIQSAAGFFPALYV